MFYTLESFTSYIAEESVTRADVLKKLIHIADRVSDPCHIDKDEKEKFLNETTDCICIGCGFKNLNNTHKVLSNGILNTNYRLTKDNYDSIFLKIKKEE